ncbi:MAG: Hpt domain-containing protein [Myxococcales bacterium]|nr:Hpt domain-containing protein [Myxococcales bacterium]
MSLVVPEPLRAATAGWKWVEDGLGVASTADLSLVVRNPALQRWSPAATLPALLGVSEDQVREALASGDGPHVFDAEATPAQQRAFPVQYTLRRHALDGDLHLLVHGRSVEAVMEQRLMLQSFSKVIDVSNRKLRHQKARIQELLDHMRCGIFSVNSKGTVTDPVSAWCQHLFGTGIARSDVFDSVLANLTDDQRSVVDSVFTTVFGEDDLQWDLMEENLPRRITYRHPDSQIRQLRVEYQPIYDDEQLLKRILMVAEDLTEVERLGRQVVETEARNQRNLDMASEATQLDAALFETFIEESRQILASCDQSCTALTLAPDDASQVDCLLRGLHTLKGNARIFKIASMQHLAHHAEDHVQQIRDTPGPPDSAQLHAVDDCLEQIRTALSEFEVVGRRMLASSQGSAAPAAGTSVPQAKIVDLRRRYAVLAAQVDPTPELEAVGQAVRALTQVPLRGLLTRMAHMCRDLARDLGKSLEDVVLVGEELLVDAKAAQLVRDSLLHALRNSVDHGIEPEEVRVAAGKPARGRIEIRCARHGGDLVVEVIDDGRGVDVNDIRRVALAQGIRTPAQLDCADDAALLDLLFLPGFSLSDTINTVSGRGIGMDVVRTSMVQIRGQVQISSTLGRGTVVELRLPVTDHERL